MLPAVLPALLPAPATPPALRHSACTGHAACTGSAARAGDAACTRVTARRNRCPSPVGVSWQGGQGAPRFSCVCPLPLLGMAALPKHSSSSGWHTAIAPSPPCLAFPPPVDYLPLRQKPPLLLPGSRVEGWHMPGWVSVCCSGVVVRCSPNRAAGCPWQRGNASFHSQR